MTYQRFEDLPVWQTAAELFDQCDEFLADAPPRLRFSFRNQLERAVLSVSNNIAEGFERGTTKELLNFLYIARGSAGEVRSMLALLLRRPWAAPLKGHLAALIASAESCSRQLRAWADSLQNSTIAGPRHLNDRARENFRKLEARKAGSANLPRSSKKRCLPITRRVRGSRRNKAYSDEAPQPALRWSASRISHVTVPAIG